MDTMRERVTALILNTGGSPEVVAGVLAIVAEDREKLVAALRKYGQHGPLCVGYITSDEDCDCGFFDALGCEAMTSSDGESWRRVAERLEGERMKLTKSLLIYGQHKSTCMYVVRDGYECTCGFDKAFLPKGVTHDK